LEYIDSGRDALLQRTGRQLQIANLPSTRRFVTNVSVTFAHCRNEYDVVSYLRVMHISHEGSANSAWSAERRDRLRATDRSFAILHREVLIDSLEPGIAGCPQFI
jgi:hypothetical protein